MIVKILYQVEANCQPGGGGNRFNMSTYIAAKDIQEALSSAEDAFGSGGLGYGLSEVVVLSLTAMGKVMVVDA